MSRDDQMRLADIAEAARAIAAYAERLDDPVTLDAILFRLSVIGEATKYLSAETTARAPEIDWAAWARLRDVIAHQYFRVSPEQIREIVEHNLPKLAAAVDQLT